MSLRCVYSWSPVIVLNVATNRSLPAGRVAVEPTGSDPGQRQPQRGGGGCLPQRPAAVTRLHPVALQPGHRLHQPRRSQVALHCTVVGGWVYVCMCVYICVRVYMYICVCVCICIYVCVCVYIYIESLMSCHLLLNLLHELANMIICKALPSIL